MPSVRIKKERKMYGLALIKNLKSLLRMKNKKTIPTIENAGRPFVRMAKPVEIPSNM